MSSSSRQQAFKFKTTQKKVGMNINECNPGSERYLLFNPCLSPAFVLFRLRPLKLQVHEDLNALCYERRSRQFTCLTDGRKLFFLWKFKNRAVIRVEAPSFLLTQTGCCVISKTVPYMLMRAAFSHSNGGLMFVADNLVWSEYKSGEVLCRWGRKWNSVRVTSWPIDSTLSEWQIISVWEAH